MYPQHMFSWRNKKNGEALLMSTHNICFRGEIRKIFTGCPPLSRPIIFIAYLWYRARLPSSVGSASDCRSRDRKFVSQLSHITLRSLSPSADSRRAVVSYCPGKVWVHHKNMPIQFWPPLIPLLYRKTGVYRGIYYFFLISAHTHRMWVVVRTASSRRF